MLTTLCQILTVTPMGQELLSQTHRGGDRNPETSSDLLRSHTGKWQDRKHAWGLSLRFCKWG